MKFAVTTTTIYEPTVLRKYRELGPDVPIIIAGDKKTPGYEVRKLASELGECHYLSPDVQEKRYPALSDAIGWNSIQRRNIATLEAAKLESDVIVSIDDDNEPIDDYFRELEQAFQPNPHHLAAGSWFNIGDQATQRFTYRGWPEDIRPAAFFGMNGQLHEIGVVNGLIYGDPDINAQERIDRNPQVGHYTTAAMEGIALDPAVTWSPINAQNTAYRAELAPLMLQLPHVGRYDDIWGSYIAQTVLAGTGLHVLFGPPFVTQDRNEQDLQKNLADEQHGIQFTPALVEHLRSLKVPEGTVLQRLAYVLEALEFCSTFEDHDLPFYFFQEWLRAWE